MSGLGDLGGHVVDNTDQGPQETADHVGAMLRSGALRLDFAAAR